MATNNTIASQIARIQEDKSTIRNKLIELGLASSTDNLDKLATTISKIENHGAIEADVTEGTTYTIPKGYHNGAGVIHAKSDTVGDSESYKTQPKSVTPTKEQQTVGPDTGYYALSSVTVAPIPDAYQDVTDVTATKADVLAGKVFVTSDGSIVTGEMKNNGKVTRVLSGVQPSYTIEKGYHDGTGSVYISFGEKTVTPTKETQEVIPESPQVLSKVTVNPIPDNFADSTDATATAAKILAGETAYIGDENGKAIKVEGTMPNNAGKETKLGIGSGIYMIPEGYHNGQGMVVVDFEEKTATPTKVKQTITPANGKALSRVEINPIPSAYQDVTSVTATAAHVIAGKKFVDATGAVVTGTIVDHGQGQIFTVDGLNTTSASIPAGFYAGDQTSAHFDDTAIVEALSAI